MPDEFFFIDFLKYFALNKFYLVPFAWKEFKL